MTTFYDKTVKESLVSLDVDPEFGLTDGEVFRRRKKYGKNILNLKTVPLWRKLIEPFVDLFMVILLIALVLSIIQGSISEIIIISIDIFCDAMIFYVQQFSTERILRNLRKEVAHKVRVLRGGKEQEVDASDLVPGDIVFLVEGERIPADGRIIEESGVLTNESMLTGESDSVVKDSRAIHGVKKVYEQKNMVFSGSFVITGSGRMLVTATGNSTEYGHIASLASSTDTLSPIQEKINKLVVKIAIFILILAVFVLGIQLIEGIDFFSAAEFTLALIVSAVPEDLPIATAIILAFGATRMARRHALIRELRSIESIGVVTTIACDKTGTLTENHLSLSEAWSPRPTNIDDFLIRSALPASGSGDPMDICLWEYAEKKFTKNLLTRPESPLHSYAFDQSIRMSGNMFREKSAYIIYIKGSPEVILRRCNLSEKERVSVLARLDEFASFGYKVLALATVKTSREINELSRLEAKEKFTFLGLAAVSDTVRREARASIRETKKSGVSVKMITGDHAGTAFAIGKTLGLVKKPEEVLDCTKLADLDIDTLAERAKTVSIFARVTPEDKFRILEAIKRTEIVAMTGDGINDVPALRSAHVGIAMGDGPSIVEDAADIVLVDNNFSSITAAIKEGRVVLANIRRMLIYLLATNLGEVITQIIAIIFGHAGLLLPIQILWVNLVTDSLMIIPIGLEPPESHVMKEKPESRDAPILSSFMIRRIVLISVTMSAITTIIYFVSLRFLSREESNTLAFTALVVMQWANAFNMRGLYESCFRRLRVKNSLFALAFVFAMILQVVASFGPLMGFVSVVPVPALPLVITILVSFFVPILVVEFEKLINKTRKSVVNNTTKK